MPSLISVAKKNDIACGKALSVAVGARRVALFNVDGKFFAIEDQCTHAGASLAEGTLAGTVVTCPWHGATFDVATGAVLSAPAFENVATYKVQVQGEDVQIETP